jgi:hypothetical protein
MELRAVAVLSANASETTKRSARQLTDVTANALECREALAKKAIGCARSATIALVQILARCATQTQSKRQKKKKSQHQVAKAPGTERTINGVLEEKQGSKNNKTEHDATILQ